MSREDSMVHSKLSSYSVIFCLLPLGDKSAKLRLEQRGEVESRWWNYFGWSFAGEAYRPSYCTYLRLPYRQP